MSPDYYILLKISPDNLAILKDLGLSGILLGVLILLAAPMIWIQIHITKHNASLRRQDRVFWVKTTRSKPRIES